MYREDVISPCCNHLSGVHHCSFGINEELPIFISIHYAVCKFCIRPFIRVVRKDPIDRIATFVLVALWETYTVESLWELWCVVILIFYMHYYPNCGLPGDTTAICNGNLNAGIN